MPAITVEHLTKVYRTPLKDPGVGGALKALVRPRHQDKVAVDGISFSVEPGEVVGYIGVNGAGKSTTIKMLTGILLPTSGRVSVLGRDPHRQRVANVRQIGVVFGQRSQLWWDLALIESLNLIAKIYEVPPARYRELLARFADTLELKELLPVPIRNMSLGQKMRAELAATLIHEPAVVYLDEPTIGLDLIVKERIREFIRQQNRERGTTVILTTHDLGDIEELCRRVLIIDGGKLIYDGPLSMIKDRFGKYRTITFETAGAAPPIDVPFGAELVEQDERRLVLRFDRSVTSASKVAAALMRQVEVADFALAEPDLASIIKQIYGGALREIAPTPERSSVGALGLVGASDD
ncbi:MAG: ATP-binding cassette domain-containing protein [Kouleothrix sp.]|nr:ATP-binding cassette domain-containing protein [Kouleothrix sp.]